MSFIKKWEKDTLETLRKSRNAISNYRAGLKEMFEGQYDESLPKTVQQEFKRIMNIMNEVGKRVENIKNTTVKTRKLIPLS